MTDREELVSMAYEIINKIGKDKIRSDVTSNIRIADGYMHTLLSRSTRQFSYKLDDYSLITLYEIFLHFMLTACTIPSQRKVEISYLSLDLVIPNLHTLSKSPRDAIILLFIRDPDATPFKTVESIQSLFGIKADDLNIWSIATLDLSTSHTTYVIDLDSRNMQHLSIIQDIDIFLKKRRDKSFRFVSG